MWAKPIRIVAFGAGIGVALPAWAVEAVESGPEASGDWNAALVTWLGRAALLAIWVALTVGTFSPTGSTRRHIARRAGYAALGCSTLHGVLLLQGLMGEEEGIGVLRGKPYAVLGVTAWGLLISTAYWKRRVTRAASRLASWRWAEAAGLLAALHFLWASDLATEALFAAAAAGCLPFALRASRLRSDRVCVRVSRLDGAPSFIKAKNTFDHGI